MKYHLEITGKVKNLGPAAHAITDIEGDPALEFNADFLERWQTTPNFALFNRLTSDSVLFSIVEPRHPCAGGLSVDDIQRRFSELHLGERVSEGREALGKHIATGQKRVVSVFNNLWADLESKRAEQKQQRHEKGHHHSHSPPGHKSPRVRPLDVRPSLDERTRSPPPLSPPSASSNAKPPLSQRSTSYIGSWTSWAQEKRKEWQARRSVSPSVSIDTS
ncbi:late secretory pathway protein avl9, partial [Ascosphaera atra]